MANFISREEALENFRRDSGFGKSIDTLSSNPLPHTIVVEPGETDSFGVRNLLNRLQAMPEVDLAPYREFEGLALVDRQVEPPHREGLAVAFVDALEDDRGQRTTSRRCDLRSAP